MNMFPNKSILVVEDNAALLNLYSNQLTELGFDVSSALTIQEAIDLINVRVFHIAWVDLDFSLQENQVKKKHEDGQPEIVVATSSNYDGYKVIEKLRSPDEGTQIMVVTNYDYGREALKSVLEFGANDFFGKRAIHTAGSLEEVVPVLRSLLSKCTLDDMAEYEEVNSKIFSKKVDSYYSSLIVSKLKKDANAVNQALRIMYQAIKPIRRIKNSESLLGWDEVSKCVTGTAWSKKFGHAVNIKLGDHVPSHAAVFQRERPISMSVELSDEGRHKFEE